MIEYMSVRHAVILEGNMVKVNRTILDFCNSIFRRSNRALFLQNFCNSLCTFNRESDHDKDHGKHHERYQNLEGICQQCGELTYIEVNTTRNDNCLGTNPEDEDHDDIHRHLHQRVVQSKNSLCLSKELLDFTRSLIELLLFIILTYIRFDNTDTVDIFFNRLIEQVILRETLFEQRHCHLGNNKQADGKEWNNIQEDDSNPATHDVCHNKREHEVHRCTDCCTDDHHKCHLYVHNIRCESCDQGSIRELIDVLE